MACPVTLRPVRLTGIVMEGARTARAIFVRTAALAQRWNGYRGRVPLLLVDLDNTLIDQAGAFDRWAREFVSGRESGAGPVL
jgi:hypothetical protein